MNPARRPTSIPSQKQAKSERSASNKFADLYQDFRRREFKQQELQEEKGKRDDEKVEECTFKPEISPSP
jgi:hypothetical protein